MRYHKIKLAALVLAAFAVGPIFGASLEELLDSSHAAALRAGDRLSEAQFSDPRPLLAPRHPGLKVILEGIRTTLQPGIMVETLSLYKKSGKTANSVWTTQEQQALFNHILALSTLEGLQYYSASREAWRIFYETSTVIDGPSTKKPLVDPVYTYLPGELTLYARQKDLTFGDNVYRYDYRVFPNSLVFVQQNLTSLTAGIIPAVGKNNLHSVVAVIDAGDSLLIYAASLAKARALPGLKDRIGNSFANRAAAVLNWFTMQADKVFGS